MAAPKLPANATAIYPSKPTGPVLPDNASVVVREHTRKPRYNPARIGIENAMLATRGVPIPATDAIIEQLPTIGAFIPNPGGPALGTGAGAIARQALSNEPPNPMTARLVSGIVPAAAEPGSAASRLLDVAENVGAARAADLLGAGLKFGGTLLERGAMNLTPEAGKVAIAERIMATKAGLAKLVSKIGGVAGETRGVLRRAQAISQEAGFPLAWQARNIGDDVARQLTPEFEKLPIDADALANLEKWNKQFFGRKNPVMNAEQLHEMKQKADIIAKPIYKALESGEIVDPQVQAWGMYNKAIADNAREKLAGKLLPDGTRIGGLPGGLADKYAQLNERQSGLIRLKGEAWPTVRAGEKGGVAAKIARRGPSGYTYGAALLGGGTGAAAGHDWKSRTVYGGLGALGFAGLSLPQTLSFLALLASNPALAKSLGVGVRAGTAAATAPERP